MYVCIYIVHTQILGKGKLLFAMWLIVINHFDSPKKQKTKKKNNLFYFIELQNCSIFT